MAVSHSRSDAARHAASAMERMTALGIAPTPENFSVWYAYASGSDPDIAHRIDRMLENGIAFTETLCAELYSRSRIFEADEAAEERDAALRDVSEEVERSVERVMMLLDEAGADAARYGETLADVDGALREPDAASRMHRMMTELLAETRRVAEQNRKVNERLLQSNLEINQLKGRIVAIRTEAMRDGLTGLANRRSFDECLREAAIDARASGLPMSLLILDIDHFKRFNDTYGHQLGDEVLRLVAGCLIECTKGRDLPARYGGEEFAIVLPATDLDGAAFVGEQIRAVVANKQIVRKANGETLGGVTLSVGASEYVAGEPLENTIARADAALYAAKAAGRNRVDAAPAPGAALARLRTVSGQDVA